MKTTKDLFDGYHRFRKGEYARDHDLYERLGKGQDPDIMLIACADSRCEPSDIFDATPGQLFVVRNVANLVPPYEDDGGVHGVSAAVEFAVTGLNVKHIVVLGHGSCGGIAASLAAAKSPTAGEFVGPWVSLLDGTRADVLAASPADPQTAFEHAAVGTSIANLMSFPFVRERVLSGELELHGAWFAIALGELQWRDRETGAFRPV